MRGWCAGGCQRRGGEHRRPDPPARAGDPRRHRAIGTDPGIADTAAILLAAEQVGAASRCLELTVDYTKERVQFGRPIGSFQALKHRMADLYVAVQSARAVVGDAIAEPTASSAALARLAASEASPRSPVRRSSCTAASRSPGSTTFSCTSNVRTAARNCSIRREQLRRLESEVF
jgi:hypothetical protein